MTFDSSGAAGGALSGGAQGFALGGPVGGAIGLAAGGILGGLSGNSAAKKRKKQKEDVIRYTNVERSELNPALAQQKRYLQQILNESTGGYDSALTNLNRSEAAGNEAIAENTKAGLGASQAAAQRAGYAGSSVGTGAAFAAARDARRASTQFQLDTARQRAGLVTGRAGARATALGALSNLEAYKAQSRNAITDKYLNFVTGQNFVQQPLDLSGLGALAAQWKGTPTTSTPSSVSGASRVSSLGATGWGRSSLLGGGSYNEGFGGS